MGICHSSCDKTRVITTAKLILDDGTLQEFNYPVMVSYLLLNNPTCFICNSDEMEFDGVVSALSDKEELQLGQLYFVLPLSRLNRRLQPGEMAALAVKASFAFAKIGGGFDIQEVARKPLNKVVTDSVKGGTGRRGKFATRLSTIAE